jgi:hypothetical protein
VLRLEEKLKDHFCTRKYSGMGCYPRNIVRHSAELGCQEKKRKQKAKSGLFSADDVRKRETMMMRRQLRHLAETRWAHYCLLRRVLRDVLTIGHHPTRSHCSGKNKSQSHEGSAKIALDVGKEAAVLNSRILATLLSCFIIAGVAMHLSNSKKPFLI